MSTKTPHPHFRDNGTLDWKTAWKDAFATAHAERKNIFIEFGREL